MGTKGKIPPPGVNSKVFDNHSLIFPNAYPPHLILWGYDKSDDKWKMCSIIHARPKSTIDLNQIKSDQLESSDFDYYIHWKGLDRRLDCWVLYEHLRSLEDEPDPDKILRIETDGNDSHHGIDMEYLREHENNTKLKTILKIKLGKHLVDTWYFSPYPRDFQNLDVLYICEFCLNFFKYETELNRHIVRCEIRHPPGNEIYRDGKISMFEVDGSLNRVYCENLCYLSKLFLDHKSLRHAVNLFLYYILTEYDDTGYHITGYFSKEKHSKNNVSCLLCLPQHQRKGYGKFLICFSYLLSRKENKAGTPERPLSDLGVASYMSYWGKILYEVLKDTNIKQYSIQEMSSMTCFEGADIVACLEEKGLLHTLSSGEPIIIANEQLLDKLKGESSVKTRTADENKLHWIPYDMYNDINELNPQH